MKRKRISDTISNLDEGIVLEATTFQKAKTAKRTAWMKWTAIAACFALVLSIGIPFIMDKLTIKDDMTDSIWLIEYNDAYYEIIEDNPESLKKFGIITTDVNASLAGEHIAYLERKNPETQRSELIVSPEKTELELLEYKAASNKAHYVFRDEDIYYIARFCNYLNPDDVSYPVSKVFEIYGIYTADDIKSIASTSTDNTWKITGNTIRDKNVITAFYNEIVGLRHYSEDEYHDLAFADHLKDAEDKGSADAEIYKQYADDLCVLVIETIDGIRFTIDYYPSYEWIKFSETQTYCQMTLEMKSWVKENMK